MRIKLSKSQWEEIGRKAKWITAEDQLQPLDGVQTSPAAITKFETGAEEKECRWCGKPYTVKRDDDGFCCDSCNSQYHSEEPAKNTQSASLTQLNKTALNYDIYKSIRKDMPPPEKVIDDGKDYKRQNAINPDIDRPDINDLINEAEVAAEYRGHKLGKWESFMRGNRSCANNKCQTCGKEVQVIDNPLPNEVDIGGEAVALNCE